jgi:RNA polymerase sigma factor (sigma-70 family)
MTEITSANMVGLSAGTKNFTNYQSFKLLKIDASILVDKTIESNSQFRKELALLIKAKNGNNKSQDLILNSFTKNIKYWSNQYINKYIPKKDEFFLDLVNEGYLVVQRRIEQVCLKELIEKEKLPKEKTKKTWFANNTNMWIRSYIKAKAEKIKNNFCNKNECSLDSIESDKDDNYLCDLKKNDKKNLISKCNENNPVNQLIIKETKNEFISNLKNLIDELNKKEKEIINYIYFNKNHDCNQSQKIKKLSKKLNISDKRIYFIHSAAIKKLKNKFKLLNNQNKFLPKDHV